MSASRARALTRFTTAGLIILLAAGAGAASRVSLGIHGEALKVRVHAPPVDGAANEAVVEVLAAALGVPRGAVWIVSGEGSLPEVCSGGAMLVGVDDEVRLAQTIERLVTDGAEREVWRARARARAAEFTWQATARKTLEVYRRVADLGEDS